MQSGIEKVSIEEVLCKKLWRGSNSSRPMALEATEVDAAFRRIDSTQQWVRSTATVCRPANSRLYSPTGRKRLFAV